MPLSPPMVIEHLYSPRDLSQCAFKLLKPGGMLIVTTPYNGYLKNLAIAGAGLMDRHWTALWDGGHIKFWSWKTMRCLLAETGFIAPEFHGAGRLPFLWKSMVVCARKPVNGSSTEHDSCVVKTYEALRNCGNRLFYVLRPACQRRERRVLGIRTCASWRGGDCHRLLSPNHNRSRMKVRQHRAHRW